MQLHELKERESSSLGVVGAAPTCPEGIQDKLLSARNDGGLFRPSFYISLLGALAVIFLAWPIWRGSFPIEIDGNEGWNAYHVDDVLFGRPLYPPKMS